MKSERLQQVARSADVRPDSPSTASAAGIDLVLVRTDAGLRAYEGRCPHQGALLGEGELDRGDSVCRNHRWRFDAETGRRRGGAECLRACPVTEEDGAVLADVEALRAGLDLRPQGGGARRRIADLPGPRGLPLLGNVLQLDKERLHSVLEGWAATHGPVYRFRLGPRPVVAIADPALIAEVLRGRPETFRRITNIDVVFSELGMPGVFSAEGRAWRPQRRLAMEALAQRNLRGFYPTLKQVAERLHRRFLAAAERGETLHIAEELKRFTVDVTTQLVFGHDMNTLERGDDVIQRRLKLLFPTLNRRLNALVPYWRLIRLPADREVERATAALRAWLAERIAEARARLAADPELADQPANFLQAMLVARDESGQPFSEEIIFGNSIQMLVAGEDTTANTLAWAIHHLCDAPEAAAALRREVDAELGAAIVPPDLASTTRLPFAAAVANEAMRLRPVAPLFFMENNRDVVLGDLAVPKGTTLFLLMRPGARDPKSFGRPDEFRPARWLSAAETGGAHEPSANLPFGSGPRICPGRGLAMLEMPVVLAMLYRSFDIERVGASASVTERFSFTMDPQNLSVRLRPRTR